MPAGFALRAATIFLVISGLASGCGSTPKHTSTGDDGAAECRATWAALEKDLSGRDTGTGPSELAERWTSVLAGVHYHAVTATASDCGDPLTAQRAAIDRLNDFESRVHDFDIELARNELSGPARLYLGSPVPSATVLAEGATPVSHARARAALDTLEHLGEQANNDLAAGWAEADAVDLDDAAATDKVVADLEFLSSQSEAYARCAQAVGVLRTVVKQQFEALSRSPRRR